MSDSSGMIGYPNLVTVGTINNGATAIQADVRHLGSKIAVNVVLLTDYTIACPPGFPFRPGMTGVIDAADLDFPRTIASGATLSLLECEAAALVGAGAAQYAA